MLADYNIHLCSRKLYCQASCVVIESSSEQRLVVNQWIKQHCGNDGKTTLPYVLNYAQMDQVEQKGFMHSSRFYYQIEFGSASQLRRFVLWALVNNIPVISSTREI